MKNVRILDCTLRDGGRIIDCAFPDNMIHQITDKLTRAKVDIIEVGFLRDWRNVEYKGNSTFFTNVEQITPFLPSASHGATYVAFVDFGMFDFESLTPMDGRSITGIRLGFTRKDYDNQRAPLIESFKIVQELGYKLFIQGVNSLNYSDRELLDVVEMVNEIMPLGFGVVDTYGAMYVDDVTRLYNLVDHNLHRDIAIDFHSHNNFQLSFSFAQEVIRLSHGTRNIILDATLAGMGKGAGNLSTELIADFLERKMAYHYDLDILFDAIDEHLYDMRQKYHWGYSVTSLMSGIYKSHPNNVDYLTQKFRLDTKDIKNILSLLDEQERQRYDYDKIDQLLQDYNNTKYDDQKEMLRLSHLLGGEPILVLVPGGTLLSHKKEIDAYIEQKHPIIISVNFISDYRDSYAFFANKKRYPALNTYQDVQLIVTSDIALDSQNEIVVNYHNLINRGYKLYDNSAAMLLNLLKRLHVAEIAIAGFDGFSQNKDNYFDNSMEVERLDSQLDFINEELRKILGKYFETVESFCRVSFVTPSMFEGLVQR